MSSTNRAEGVELPPLLTEAARLTGRGIHPDVTVALVRHYAGQEVLTDADVEKIERKVTWARQWAERAL